MNILLRLLGALLLALGAGCATQPPAAEETASAHPLLLISIDGYRPDYLARG
jgi:hypothetical protein